MKRTISALIIFLAAVSAHADFIPANAAFVGVDSRATVPTGTYAGLANPNFNRLTFLYGHQYDGSNPLLPASVSHYHGKSTRVYSGPAGSPVVVTTTNNFLPEQAGVRLELRPGSGAFLNRFITGIGAAQDYGNMTVRPAAWLNRPGATEWEIATFNSGGTAPVGRWTTPLGAANLVYEVVGLSSGLRILGMDGSVAASNAGDTFGIGSGDFAATPIFAADSTEKNYSAQLRLRDLTGTFGDSGVFEYRFRSVPEPATMVALGLGVIALLRRRRKA